MIGTKEARIAKLEGLVRMNVSSKEWSRYAKAKAYEREALRAWNELGRLWCDLQNDRFAIWDELCRMEGGTDNE